MVWTLYTGLLLIIISLIAKGITVMAPWFDPKLVTDLAGAIWFTIPLGLSLIVQFILRDVRITTVVFIGLSVLWRVGIAL